MKLLGKFKSWSRLIKPNIYGFIIILEIVFQEIVFNCLFFVRRFLAEVMKGFQHELLKVKNSYSLNW